MLWFYYVTFADTYTGSSLLLYALCVCLALVWVLLTIAISGYVLCIYNMRKYQHAGEEEEEEEVALKGDEV